ncbi:hypothetical protein IU500_19135 [Nocardia terpenica]|uniref:hypothetical protein n=1 Tax=Nocardia terpenica TaxID=455432 RepID=UPI0018951007|nr:hypothetical protein [Nocardia terpenica]MBF6062046.1 hypothetical protein [Nocardia terpenica]MBF6106154.1 hypothetical protein [Nocardia terpenica]MBF6110466.1 hypothetical protein [Nocardia terpenica]MBF6120697.1 hypothetical protein [Nocardia terpenica]MBF6151802.1 hypothetical protein [Nocardia terpenica]
MVDVLTRADYDHRQYLGSAGPVAALDDDIVARWRETYPDWAGRYWAFLSDTGDPNPQHFWLRPVNVEGRGKERS